MFFFACMHGAEDERPVAAGTKSPLLIGWIGDARRISYTNHSGVSITREVGSFRAIAYVRGSELFAACGKDLTEGQRFWPVSVGESATVLTSVTAPVEEMEDDCAHTANVSPQMPRWTLLTSAPSESLREPTQEERGTFERFDFECIPQGDVEPGNDECSEPQLLAVSDIDNNGEVEYWATQPYTWDTGIGVWTTRAGTLTPVLKACPGCSD